MSSFVLGGGSSDLELDTADGVSSAREAMVYLLEFRAHLSH